MWGRLAARMTVRLLKSARLSVADRNLLTAVMLDTLQALPLHEIINSDEQTGELMVQGRPLDIEKSRQLMTSAELALRNQALNLVREQVVYEAFVGSAIKARTTDDLTFYRAALWWGQQIEKYLRLLAQRKQEPDL